MDQTPQQKRLGRRAVLTGSAAAGLATLVGGCASGAPREPGVQVNLATGGGLPPPPAGVPPGESEGAVRAGIDAVRRMTVETLVDGAGPYRFVVDTGANRSVLSTEVADALGLAPTGQAIVHGIAGELPSTTVTVKSLAIGGLLSREVKMPVLPRRFLGADGLLGVDVLAHRRATLDFRNQRFLLAPGAEPGQLTRSRGVPDLPRGVEAITVPARHRFGQLTIVDAAIGGVKLTAFLDSGAENTVGNQALRRALGRRPGLLGERLPQVELVSVTGQLVAGELATAPPLRLGGLTLGNLSCVFADLHTFRIWQLDKGPALLIGVDVMRHFDSIELNFAKRHVVFRSSRFARGARSAG